MQDICKAQNETVEIDSNKSVTATNVKRLIPQINRDYQTFKKRKCNDKILIRHTTMQKDWEEKNGIIFEWAVTNQNTGL